MKKLLLNLAIFLFRPYRTFRLDAIKALILAEPKSDPSKSASWLLEISDFVNSEIDKQCVEMGQGIHIKHNIMSGIHSFFYERIKPGSRVLDIGCGHGAVSHSIAVHANANVIGIDLNEEGIAFGKRRFSHPLLTLVVGDATSDLPDEDFDVIVMSSLLEHIDERPKLLRKLTLRYSPEKFLIRVPLFERHYYAALKKRLGLFAYTDPDHRTEYTADSFTREIRAAGLDLFHSEVRWGDLWAECVPAGNPVNIDRAGAGP